MLEYLLLGGGFALAAAVQPGPLQAFLLSRVAAEGWRRTLPAAFAPLLSDIPIAIVALLLLSRLDATAQQVLRISGGVLLIVLGGMAFRQWRRLSTEEPALVHSAQRTLFQAALVNLLNPNPYLGWAFILGPAAVTAWRENPAIAVVFIASFYTVMVIALLAFILLIGTSEYLTPRTRHGLVLLSAILLAGLGIWQLVLGFQGILAP